MKPIRYMDAIRERYERLGYQAYRWYVAGEPPAWAPLEKPLSDCRLGVLSTAGVYRRGQVAYYYKDDTSTRAIPKSTPTGEIRFSHLTEQYLPDARRDPNCVFPIGPLRRLEDEGAIGSLADDMLSCMGAVYSQRRTREELIPAVVDRFEAQNVDAVFLIPL